MAELARELAHTKEEYNKVQVELSQSRIDLDVHVSEIQSHSNSELMNFQTLHSSATPHTSPSPVSYASTAPIVGVNDIRYVLPRVDALLRSVLPLFDRVVEAGVEQRHHELRTSSSVARHPQTKIICSAILPLSTDEHTHMVLEQCQILLHQRQNHVSRRCCTNWVSPHFHHLLFLLVFTCERMVFYEDN